MKNNGTKNVLEFISKYIYNKLDKNQPIIASILNLAKAFDTIKNVNCLLNEKDLV